MKCVLCMKFTSKSKADWVRHLDVVHHLTQKQYTLAANAVHDAYGGLEAFKRATKVAGLVLMLSMAIGCKGVNRLLGQNDDPGTPYTIPINNPAVANATPIYDQTTATQAQDDTLIATVIGTPGTYNFQQYVAGAWLPDRMNGIHNFMPGSGVSSIVVDGWKALYRRGYADVSKLTNPGIIHSNTYPVPVYQDDPARWGL